MAELDFIQNARKIAPYIEPDYAAAILHTVNNKLLAINGYADLSQAAIDVDRARYIAMMKTATDNLQQFIASLTIEAANKRSSKKSVINLLRELKRVVILWVRNRSRN